MKTIITIAALLMASSSVVANANETNQEVFTNEAYCEIAKQYANTDTRILRAYESRLGYQPTRNECQVLSQQNTVSSSPVFALDAELRALRNTSVIRIPSQTLQSMKSFSENAQRKAFNQAVTRSAPR